MPEDLGSATSLDWIPVDLLAEVVGDIAKPDEVRKSFGIFYNLVNPKTAHWKTVVQVIKSRLEKSLSKDISIVPLADWIGLLRKAEPTIIQQSQMNNDVLATRAQTGLKLISFFEGLEVGNELHEPVQWASDSIFAKSATFRNLQAVSKAWFDTWMSQWGY